MTVDIEGIGSLGNPIGGWDRYAPSVASTERATPASVVDQLDIDRRSPARCESVPKEPLYESLN